ncbi:serine hydrolase domain-containing protein [Frigidibacter sp. MR17.24]|uniref:serine hydrolase domain-containing protein n=1 Tax=Frigidibacter sp. MR17.24 TaxID=3127345 RepID=UPI003013122E
MTRPLLSRRRLVSFGLTMGLAAPALLAHPLAAGAQADRFARTRAAAGALDQLHALVILHRGREVLAEAFRGPAPDRAVNVKSVSKTLVASIAAAVIGTGRLTLDTTIGAAAPRLIPAGADPRVRDLTVADFLTMQTGLERTSGGNYGAWVSSRNWVSYVLDREMTGTPGRGMMYSTGSFHVLGAMLTEVTGESLLALARARLGRPLGVRIDGWTRDPQGFYMGGNNMALSPRAMAAFGEAWRQGGAGPAGRLVPPGWVETAWTPRTRSPFSGDAYGLGWFLFDADGTPAAYARGYGGQMIYVLPGHELVVAVTSDDSRPARSEGHAGDLKRLLVGTILPDIRA